MALSPRVVLTDPDRISDADLCDVEIRHADSFVRVRALTPDRPEWHRRRDYR